MFNAPTTDDRRAGCHCSHALPTAPLHLDYIGIYLNRKARRKEREGEPAGDPKLYLQEALLERKLPELDMRQLVELPRGLDYNEWLASHSQYTPKHYARNNQPFTSGSPPPLLA
ncbi:PREDICTED: MOB kinase activator-like 2 isoform X4 [Papilio polytes]|nr:PREDICTED: MOB kinase activator-like 2 isoform X4 [Papilio polytes]